MQHNRKSAAIKSAIVTLGVLWAKGRGLQAHAGSKELSRMLEASDGC